jgi:hypothetical protein
MWIKCLANYGFWIVILGQIVASIGQPFLRNAISNVADDNSNRKGRAIATAIIDVSSPLGGAFGYLLPVFFIAEEDALP